MTMDGMGYVLPATYVQKQDPPDPTGRFLCFVQPISWVKDEGRFWKVTTLGTEFIYV